MPSPTTARCEECSGWSRECRSSPASRGWRSGRDEWAFGTVRSSRTSRSAAGFQRCGSRVSRVSRVGTEQRPATVTIGRCPACGSPQRGEMFVSPDWIHPVPGEFPEQRCLGCDAVYPDPQPTDASLGLYYPAGDYYAYSAASRHTLFARPGRLAWTWYQIVRGILSRGYGYPVGGWGPAAAVLRRVPPIAARATHELGILLHPWQAQGTLLDVGCGAGRYLDLMRALGWSRVVGVDISAEAIAKARSLGLEAYAGDLQEIGFPDNTFDAISASHTLEHVRDPLALLREIARVAKPGARVAIVVPNVRSLGSRIFRRHWVGLET